jgi:hypothetical protein
MAVKTKSKDLQEDTADFSHQSNGDSPGVDGLEESSTTSTGSWDMADEELTTVDLSIVTIDVSTSDLGDHFQAAEAEQEIAVLKNQLARLRAENLEKSKTIEQQNTVIQDLTQKILKQDELVAENSMKTTLLEDQDARINELVKELEEKGATDEEQVTDKFYEAEEEIMELRKDLTNAADVIKTVLLVKDMFDKHALDDDCNPVQIFNDLWKGLDSTEIPELNKHASDFLGFVLEQDVRHAVAFMGNADNYKYEGRPFEDVMLTTLQKGLHAIYTRPSMLLEDNQVLNWSAHIMGFILLSQEDLDTDELTLFRILLKWIRSNEEERLDIGKKLVEHIVLEHIDPLDLSKIVRPSGLVSESVLCDAYGKQAADRSIVGKRRVRKAVPAVPLEECTEHNWDTSNSNMLSSTGHWKTGRISSFPLKGFDRFGWSVRVENAGDILFGVSSSSFHRDEQDLSKFGMFLPKCELKKDSVVSFCLDRKVSLTTLHASISGIGSKSVSLPLADLKDDLLVTTSVQNGACVEFLGFDG